MTRPYKLLVVILFFGCHEATKETVNNDKQANGSKNLGSAFKSNDTSASEKTADIKMPEGTIQVQTNFLTDPLHIANNSVKILQTGSFHKDDVSANSARLKWKGLFKTNDRFYIKDADVKFSRQHDGEVDDHTQNTGWRVQCGEKDSTKLLISGLNELNNGEINQIALSKGTLLPGEKEEFNYSGTTYTLYASGKKKDGYIYNYKLFLMATVKGHSFNQLLIAQPFFGQAFTDQVLTTIYFAGDLDGDNIPDFLIDTTDALTATVPGLYLSKPAGDKAILKLVASCGSSD
jgi:hypothetical protein